MDLGQPNNGFTSPLPSQFELLAYDRQSAFLSSFTSVDRLQGVVRHQRRRRDYRDVGSAGVRRTVEPLGRASDHGAHDLKRFEEPERDAWYA